MEDSKYGLEYIHKAIHISKPGSKVLDIGCGSNGRFITEFLKKEFSVTGIDTSSEMIRLLKEKHESIKLINDDFINWNSEDRFDLVIAWDSIFHAPRNLQETLVTKMCNLLNIGGVLLFTAGGIDSERSGEMEGVSFDYGSLKYLDYLRIIDEMGCNTILMESDQYPQDHMVFICENSN